LESKQIRSKFLEFFRTRGHTVVQSSPLVPIGDPTLLFANAGMNQFKEYFLGKTEPPYNRAASAQKCMRVSGKHNDLEDVGRDGTHHTFFEMMGNWSFGDYFKKGAVEMAWELLTDGYGLDPDRLWATVYTDDDEAEEIWRKILPSNKILRCGAKDNFWEMAATGPCGPCSEIHYDMGFGQGLKPNDPGGRFVEIWNLVFMQFFKDESGAMEPLPQQHVDTGLGFERLVSILQGCEENYETDLFAPIISRIEEITGAEYDNPDESFAMKVMADHIRALAFAIADGALPGNEGRGYVLRRILRRAARFSRKIDHREPIMFRLVAPLTDIMGDVYPELKSKNEHIVRVIKAEEESFAQTLDIGLELFEDLVKKAQDKGEMTIWGEDAFKLYDTYGFPVDLTELMASERGLIVDHVGFEREMQKQRDRSRGSAKFAVKHDLGAGDWIEKTEGDDSKFVGYEKNEDQAKLRRYQIDGDKIKLILDQTPFYAESGGQVGDVGEIIGDGWKAVIEDTVKESESFVHIGRIEGEIGDSADVIARIDADRRDSIRRNHTATHLLHFALRKVLGDHVHQSGSHVAPDRFRFDYTHFEAPSKAQLRKIERIVNEVAMADIPVCSREMAYREALDKGAIALFGEKYGDSVRVISIEAVSQELCGGTHLTRTGEMGAFLIRSEGSVGSGQRRIEAVTGGGVLEWINILRENQNEIAGILKAGQGEDLVEKTRAIIAERKELEDIIEELRREQTGDTAELLVEKASTYPRGRFIVEEVKVNDREQLANLVDELKDKLSSGAVFLVSEIDGKIALISGVTPDLIEIGVHAGDLIKGAAGVTGGSGGGRPDFAQGGGRDASLVPDALEWVRDQLKTKLRG